MTSYIFPGQGSQYVGMARDFNDNFKVAKDTFQEIEDYVDPNQSINSSTVYLSAGYSKKIKQTQFNFSSSNYLFGDSKSSSIKSTIELDLKKKNNLKIALSLLNSTPDYNQLLFSSNYVNYNWDNDPERGKPHLLAPRVQKSLVIQIWHSFNLIMLVSGLEPGFVSNSLTQSPPSYAHAEVL